MADLAKRNLVRIVSGRDHCHSHGFLVGIPRRQDMKISMNIQHIEFTTPNTSWLVTGHKLFKFIFQ
ncbi:MAG: hypothetical protein RLZZ282_1438 [Verrucomicrobiota bacterium]|jgi:hypothetical protein